MKNVLLINTTDDGSKWQFTMTCSGPRTRTSAVYLKMWRVSKHLRQSTYEWAGGVCVSCLRALQSWLMCIESSCVMHRHTHTRLHTNTHIALMPSPAMRQIFSLLPTVAVAMATSSGFLDLKSWIWQEVWASPGGGGDNKRGVDRSRCGPPPPPPPPCVCTGPLRGADCSQNIDSLCKYVLASGLHAGQGFTNTDAGSCWLYPTALHLPQRRSSVRKKNQTWNHFKIFFTDSFCWSLLVFRCFSWE